MVTFNHSQHIIYKITCLPAFIFEGFRRGDTCLVEADPKGEADTLPIDTDPTMTQADVFRPLRSSRMARVGIEVSFVGVNQTDRAGYAATARQQMLVDFVTDLNRKFHAIMCV